MESIHQAGDASAVREGGEVGEEEEGEAGAFDEARCVRLYPPRCGSGCGRWSPDMGGAPARNIRETAPDWM